MDLSSVQQQESASSVWNQLEAVSSDEAQTIINAIKEARRINATSVTVDGRLSASSERELLRKNYRLTRVVDGVTRIDFAAPIVHVTADGKDVMVKLNAASSPARSAADEVSPAYRLMQQRERDDEALARGERLPIPLPENQPQHRH